MTRRQRTVAGAAALTAALALAGPASAHVEVLPREVVAEKAVELTVRVPTERDLPTTAVRVDFPENVTVFSFADPPLGWTLRPRRSDDGRIVGVEYEGGRIGVDRYQDFSFLGTPLEPGPTVWPSRQTYADGRVKPWTRPPEAEGDAAVETGPTDPGPAAEVEVLAADDAATAGALVADESNRDGSGAAIWLGVIAIGISALAALGVGLLWSSRPARLPEDPTQ